MASFKSFEEIIAWQKARILTKEIYLTTNKGKFEKDYGLKDQFRRASVSVMANIAEGFERRGDKEFVRFLNISKGSLAEVKSHAYVALDVEYIDEKIFNDFVLKIDEIAMLLSGLIKYLKTENN